jgi:hypothetical protein
MCGLEFLTQGNVPEAVTDRVERRIVVVIERSENRRWVAVKRIDHARGNLGAPQHPEWVQPDGECPTCDSYEARLVELLDTLTRSASSESVAAPYPVFQQRLT